MSTAAMRDKAVASVSPRQSPSSAIFASIFAAADSGGRDFFTFIRFYLTGIASGWPFSVMSVVTSFSGFVLLVLMPSWTYVGLAGSDSK